MSHSWIYEEDPARLKPACHVCPHPKWKNGQWMMFFPNSLIDEKWDQAVDLYRRGKLTGVQSMKVICLLLVFECPSCLFTFLRKLYKKFFSGFYLSRKSEPEHQKSTMSICNDSCDHFLLWTIRS